MAEKTLKLHQEVDPIYFSPNFKPMVKLVEILSAEARRAKHTTGDDSDDDTLRTGVRVHALEGAVATLADLGPAATVRDLRRAVARAVGVAAADQRLYASAAGRLELVKDEDATLLDAGVWLPDEPRGAVHLRSAAYERLAADMARNPGLRWGASMERGEGLEDLDLCFILCLVSVCLFDAQLLSVFLSTSSSTVTPSTRRN